MQYHMVLVLAETETNFTPALTSVLNVVWAEESVTHCMRIFTIQLLGKTSISGCCPVLTFH